MKNTLLTCFMVAMLSACTSISESVTVAEPSPTRAEITMGDGSDNWIKTKGATRNGSTFIFPEVKIDGNGWLVMHPFTDGKPNGKIYVGHTYIKDGLNTNISISVDPEPVSGEMFIVMLHRDVEEDRIFDFVFVDEYHVEDRAVFEGTKMIAHAYQAP
ncbi:hypothetical protein [Parvularcula sp. IMCC14364]|uniref:DUF7282 domain-containing protein n=1 Tax=Parvularcula sp. IMCC14364 TaxID=3067902 RepID=UPI002741856F|nr:hypothetical protein [Parvularcula sp. IMCC14364]